MVVIGGVAGGASAAARGRRLDEDAEIILIERGEYVSFANCGLPYHIGGTIVDRQRLLVQTPQMLYGNLRIDVRVKTEAIAIDRDRKEVKVRNLADGSEYAIAYDKLVLSPGAEPIRPPIPGIDDPRVLTLRSMSDMDAIKSIVDDQKPAHSVIVGGGYIGLEMAEALRERGIGVTLAELGAQVMAPVDPEIATPLHQHLELKGVDLRLGTSVTGFAASGDALQANLSTGESVECGLAILAVGVKPETKLAKDAGLEVGERGGILVDSHMRTNDPDIFAVGDAVEVKDFVGGFQTLIPLAGPANRQGRIAADNAFGRNSAYKDTQGTGICKVFDLAVGMTGMNEKSLKRTATAYEKVYVHPTNHASYYPGASPISLKLLFSPSDGKILGAQAVGTDGIDKRIDVLAVAIRAGMTVYDLEELELSYAPPYGSAKDPVNYAGFVASNVLRGDDVICHAEEMIEPREDQVILDVRKAFEVQTGIIPGAIHIPLDELRDRIGEVPRDKEVIAYCAVGLRGYLACRILTQKGFRCRNLSGGIKTYAAVVGHLPKSTEPPKAEACDDSGISCRAMNEQKTDDEAVRIVEEVDACGLQCPGPIQRVHERIATLAAGEAVRITATDAAFATDIVAWCHSTGNRLIDVQAEGGRYKATVAKGGPVPPSPRRRGPG